MAVCLSPGKNDNNMSQGEFVFRATVQSLSGIFKKEHGGLDLTNVRCLMCVERRVEIHSIVSEAYAA